MALTTSLPQLPFRFGAQATSVTLSQRRLWVLCRNGSEAGAAVNVLDHLITLSSIKQASKRSSGISSANHQARHQASTDASQALSSRRDTYPRRHQRAAVAASGFETSHQSG